MLSSQLQICILALTSAALSGAVAVRRLGADRGDALGLFATFFTLYNGVLLFCIAVTSTETISAAAFPLAYSPEVYVDSAYLSLLAAIGLFVGHCYFGGLAIVGKRFIGHAPRVSPAACLTIGVGFFVFGVCLLFADYQRIGGYFALLAMDRTQRYLLLSSHRGGLPYSTFVQVAFAFAAFGEACARRKTCTVILWAMLGVWGILLSLLGDRRLIVYAVVIILVARSSTRKVGVRMSLKRGVILALIAMVVLLYGQLRFLITAIGSNSVSPALAVQWISDNASIRWLAPTDSELAGPYLTLLQNVDERAEYHYGETYIRSILEVAPRSLYPGEKPPSLCDRFAHDISVRTGLPEYGWGYSPVAEAFINFGYFGVLPVFVLLSGFLCWFSGLRYKSWMAAIIFSALSPEALNANRINFQNVLQESVFAFFAVILGLSFSVLWVPPRKKTPANTTSESRAGSR